MIGLSDVAYEYEREGQTWLGLPVDVSAALIVLASAGMALRQVLDDPKFRALPSWERLDGLVAASGLVKSSEAALTAAIATHRG